MTPPAEANAPRGPALAALGAVLALIVCCLLVPAVIGAAWLLAVGTAVEAALIAAALALGAVAIHRRRCGTRAAESQARR